MTDKVQKIREEVEKLKSQLIRGACSSQIAMETMCKEEAYNEVLAILDTVQEEPKKCMYAKENYTDEDRKVLCDGCEEECKYAQKKEPVSRDYREIYKNIAQSDAFKSAYENKSLGEVISVEGEEPVSDECIYNRTLEERQRSCKFCSAACQVRIKEPVSEDLEEALAREWKGYNDRGAATVDALEDNTQELAFAKGFYRGAQWQKANLWKPANGDDLPEYDREVIVLIKYNAQRNIHDEEYSTYRVGFGHRPNPDGWDGKNIDTNEVTHYTPKLYDKGGWNAPDIVYWLDVGLPKGIEL